MNKTQAGRCLTLAYYLKTEVPMRRFDQEHWAATSDPLAVDSTGPITEICGTSACALGWSTAVWPRKFRLNFGGNESNRHLFKAYVEALFEDGWDYVGSEDCFVREWFGFTPMESSRVFGTEPMTPKQKAKQIEQIVAAHGWEYA